MLERPQAGVHSPGSLADLCAWFPDDAACLDYPDWLRSADGFVCPHCASGVAWQLCDGRYSCGGCKRRVSAGTTFHGTRTPLTVWFEAAWLMMTLKAGRSALNLQRVVGLGSHQTARTMLHSYREVMVVSARDRWSGEIEVDEMVVGASRSLATGAVAPRARRSWPAPSNARRMAAGASAVPGSPSSPT